MRLSEKCARFLTVPVKVLSETEGCITGVQYGKQIGIAFHPELDDDTFVYEYFLGLIG